MNRATGSAPLDRTADAGGSRRRWIAKASALLAQERRRAAETPLLRLEIEELAPVRFCLKDETAHPSGSLKHRLAHALFSHAICSGAVGPDSLIVEASSGSTAISEAWFARALGLRFLAVVPASTAPAKLAAIREMGAEVALVPAGKDICAEASILANARGGYFMNQFARALEATDWRGANNIADSLFGQLLAAGDPAPTWVVMGAGTGGTSATIGRYIRLRPELADVRLCVVDPEGSAFFTGFVRDDPGATGRASPVVEGIGRARVEPGFMPRLIDRMIAVPDAASIAAVHWLRERTGRAFGPSTGTNVVGALLLGAELRARGEGGCIALFGCDPGDRYRQTIYDPQWLDANGHDIDGWRDLVPRLAELGCRSADAAD